MVMPVVPKQVSEEKKYTKTETVPDYYVIVVISFYCDDDPTLFFL